MSRNTRSALGLGIAFIGIVIGFILMRRTLVIQATVANEAASARPSENAVNQIPPSSSFFQANNSSRDNVTPEQNNMEKPKTNSPK